MDRCPKCRGAMRAEPAAFMCVNCGRRERRPAIPIDEIRQDDLDRSLRCRSAESRALTQCDTCFTKVAPGVLRCERCKLKYRLSRLPEGERQRILGSVGLLVLD